MTRSAATGTRARALVPLLALAIGLTGCGAAASPSPSPTATPSPTPTAAPTPTATPLPTPSATPSAAATASAAPSVDPSSDLTIAAPYQLVPLDRITSAAMQAGMAQALGSFAGILQLGFRQATKDGKPACIVMVMEFPGLGAVDQPGFLDNLATGLKGQAGTVTESTILKHPVRIVSNGAQSMGMYVRKEGVVVPICQTPEAATDVVTALIKAEP